MKSQLQYILPLLFSLLICGAAVRITPGVSGTRQSDSLEQPCPGETLVYTCSEADISLTWIVSGIQLHTCIAGVPTSFGTEVDPTTGATARAMDPGVGVRLTSTLTINATDNDGVIIDCFDSGGPTEAVNVTLDLADPLMPPEYDCTLTGQRRLRLEWINNNMNADDSVDEYRACSCIGGGCPCVPTACGDLSNNCVREFEADQVNNFMFTAVNCGSQESTATTLTVDAEADAPTINEVCVEYNQSTEGLRNIAVTWDTVPPISVPVGCVEGIDQQYNVRCGDNFGSRGLDLLQSTVCNGGMCQFESSASTGCTLSVESVNVMGTRTTNQDIPGTTPLNVTVSDGRRITCNVTCNISYGVDPNFETLPNTNTSGPAGVELTQLDEGEENFYVVSADIGSLTVKVKGSLRTECACSELVSGSGTCPDSGILAIPNGMVTYGSVSIGSEATYQCDDGFSLSGARNRTCQGDGSWSDSQPTCQEGSSFPRKAIPGIIVGVIIMLIAIGVIIGILIQWQCILGKDTPKWLIVTIVILCFVFVGFGILLYLLIRRWCTKDKTDSPDSPDSGKGKKPRGKKSQDIPMESGGEYGRLQHGGTLTPPYTDPSADPMYSHLAAGKAEEGSAEEYSQLQRQKPAKPVANISDANYSHFEGDAPPVPPPPSSRPSRLPSQGQHKRQPPTVPPHTVADPDPPLPEVYSEVNQGLRYMTKQTSSTGL